MRSSRLKYMRLILSLMRSQYRDRVVALDGCDLIRAFRKVYYGRSLTRELFSRPTYKANIQGFRRFSPLYCKSIVLIRELSASGRR